MNLVILNTIRSIDLLKGLLTSDKIVFFEQTLVDLIKNDELNQAEISFYEELLKEFKTKDLVSTINFLDTSRSNYLFKIFDKPCDKDWNTLLPTNDNNVKFCNTCNRNVFKVYDKTEYRKRKQLNQCVAITFSLKENYLESSGCEMTAINEHYLMGSPAYIEDEK